MVRIGEHIIRHYKEFLAKGEVRHLQYSKNMDDHIDFTSDLLTDSILIESQSQIMQTPEAR